MKDPTRLAHGLNSWLTFEEMCGRSALFSESYLTAPLGQLLASRYGARLIAEYPHPVLTTGKTGVGRKPALDFAVLDAPAHVELAIETKWLSKSNTLHRDIITDLVRLALVVNAHEAEGWLIVAGKAPNLKKFITSPKYKGHPKHLGSDPILPIGKTRSGTLRLHPPALFRGKLLASALKPFDGLKLPKSISTTYFGPNPDDLATGQYVTCLWRVNKRKTNTIFIMGTNPSMELSK